MGKMAPNLTILVGSAVAAKLVGIAGGLIKLSKIPSSNVQLLGSNKTTLTGLSSGNVKSNQGFVYQCDLVTGVPANLRVKTARLVAGKVVLATRIDCYQEDPTGITGRQYREEIEKKS